MRDNYLDETRTSKISWSTLRTERASIRALVQLPPHLQALLNRAPMVVGHPPLTRQNVNLQEKKTLITQEKNMSMVRNIINLIIKTNTLIKNLTITISVTLHTHLQTTRTVRTTGIKINLIKIDTYRKNNWNKN